MTSFPCSPTLSDWKQQAHILSTEGDYARAAKLYEQGLIVEPADKSHYWYLGLMFLLQGQEAEAQTTWLLGMAEGEPEEIELWTEELVQVMQVEAERQKELGNYAMAWAIRQHIREIRPLEINNLLHLIGLSTLLRTYTGEEVTELGLIELLSSERRQSVDSELLTQVLYNVLLEQPLHPSSLELTDASLPYVQDIPPFIKTLTDFVNELAYSAKRADLAVRYTEMLWRLDPQHKELMRLLASFYQDNCAFDKGIEAAKICYAAMKTLEDKIYANLLIMRGLMMSGGYWEEFSSALEQQKEMITSLVEQQPTDLDPSAAIRLYLALFFVPYFQDRPAEHRKFCKVLAQLVQLNIENHDKEQVERCRKRLASLPLATQPTKRLKIGYISYCLRSHSVGWLARWLFQYHDRENFEIYAYLVSSQKTCDSLQEWYVSQVHKAHKLALDSEEISEKISQDEIDILIDLDSLTLTTICQVMAIKPAPIQATWLGWDASGIPTIDYFIADPYVLPESAQDYYTEEIWRLPQTYIAVDGFEVGIPKLRRDLLNIPSDAVVYLSIQRGYKYNPTTARLQMQILKEVPHSYFVIKGFANQESLKKFFLEIAESEGVSCDRLKFIPLASSEAEHRANLLIADVVLDTYPYNGATTTLETLWMGIPLVTRVGQQFAARNSYTMMMNVGVTEGIAWTDEEYIEWGVRLGKDSEMRQKIAWKLRQSRQTSPLWNTKKFTLEMENAYTQMWNRYLETK